MGIYSYTAEPPVTHSIVLSARVITPQVSVMNQRKGGSSQTCDCGFNFQMEKLLCSIGSSSSLPSTASRSRQDQPPNGWPTDTLTGTHGTQTPAHTPLPCFPFNPQFLEPDPEHREI